MTDLEVERDFWKKAAEEALALLFAQEGVSIALRAKLIEACTIGEDEDLRCGPAYAWFRQVREAAEADEGPCEE